MHQIAIAGGQLNPSFAWSCAEWRLCCGWRWQLGGPDAVIADATLKALSASPFKLFMKAFWLRNGFPLSWALASVVQLRWLCSERYF